MKTLNDYIKVYKTQIALGDVKEAYRSLIRFMMELRTQFHHELPDHFISGSIYQGYMDMSFFAVISPALKEKKLKVIVLLDHENVSFELWLCGRNKKVQKKYWVVFKQSDFGNYTIPADIKGVDSILEHQLISEPDFDNLEQLADQIKVGVLEFIENLEQFFDK
ncbi:MAG: hypothetical protein AAF502_06795 [Bacteroidota bacterium]